MPLRFEASTEASIISVSARNSLVPGKTQEVSEHLYFADQMPGFQPKPSDSERTVTRRRVLLLLIREVSPLRQFNR